MSLKGKAAIEGIDDLKPMKTAEEELFHPTIKGTTSASSSTGWQLTTSLEFVCLYPFHPRQHVIVGQASPFAFFPLPSLVF